MKRSLLIAFALLALVVGFALVAQWQPPSAVAKPKLSERLFEMRTYTTHAGKLSHLHDRFRNHTNHLFVKHGMSLIAYWTPVDQKDTLVYVLAYPDRAARDKSWDGFINDPEWKRVFAESHKTAGGPIVKDVVELFMKPTDYSPIR